MSSKRIGSLRLVICLLMLMFCIQLCAGNNFFAYVHGREPTGTFKPQVLKGKLFRLCQTFFDRAPVSSTKRTSRDQKIGRICYPVFIENNYRPKRFD